MSKYDDFNLDIKKTSFDTSGSDTIPARIATAGPICYTATQSTAFFCGPSELDCVSSSYGECPPYTETCSQCRSYCGGACKR